MSITFCLGHFLWSLHFYLSLVRPSYLAIENRDPQICMPLMRVTSIPMSFVENHDHCRQHWDIKHCWAVVVAVHVGASMALSLPSVVDDVAVVLLDSYAVAAAAMKTFGRWLLGLWSQETLLCCQHLLWLRPYDVLRI